MRGLTAIDAAMVLIVVLLIVQIWLLSATLESFLAGHREAAIPGAIISGVLFLACLALYLFVARIDAEVRKG
jgi:predicted Co/Zn/Cd cation transporter (cation efflux family)